jgi:hypothetical protein
LQALLRTGKSATTAVLTTINQRFSVYFGTLTFANDLRVMTKAHEIYMDVLSNLKAKATGDWQIYVLYQPLPPSYWRQSASKGGNMLGLERFGEQVLCRKFNLGSQNDCTLISDFSVPTLHLLARR